MSQIQIIPLEDHLESQRDEVMETQTFVTGEHYRHGIRVDDVEIENTHWHAEEPCEVWNQDGVTSLFRMRTTGRRLGVSADVICSLSVAQLRELAVKLNEAADSLEAQQRQIGGVK